MQSGPGVRGRRDNARIRDLPAHMGKWPVPGGKRSGDRGGTSLRRQRKELSAGELHLGLCAVVGLGDQGHGVLPRNDDSGDICLPDGG